MSLDPEYSVGIGLFAFRAIVKVALFETERFEAEDGQILDCKEYLRTYGVTAESYSAAAAIVEELAGRSPEDTDAKPDGWIDEIELALAEPESEDQDMVYLAPIRQKSEAVRDALS